MEKNKVFIIAEAGCNHNGKLHLAKKLIDIASRSCADAVKFQSFNTEELLTKNAPKAKYSKKYTRKFKTQFEMQKSLQLSYSDHLELSNYCKYKKIKFLSSSFDIQSSMMLEKMRMKIFKIPSGEITNLPNLQLIGSFKVKIILSTGMSTLKEIGEAIKVLVKAGTKKQNITLLHCTTDYPAKMSDVNLLAMIKLKDKFNVNIGYSDHTLGSEISLAAVALGASVIEKHITISKKMRGPDHHASLEEKEFAEMVRSIRNLEIALGNDKKKPSRGEIKNIITVRKSIKARHFIKRGEIFSRHNLLIARPFSGISPMKWQKVIGKKAKKSFKKGEDIML